MCLVPSIITVVEYILLRTSKYYTALVEEPSISFQCCKYGPKYTKNVGSMCLKKSEYPSQQIMHDPKNPH